MSRLQRNENFFRAGVGGEAAAAKVRRAYQRCAETGTLNLSNQGLSGALPDSVCGFQEASWAEKWWEQCPVLKVDVSLNTLEQVPCSIGHLTDCEAFVAYSNQLSEVPPELFALPLKQLNLRSNALLSLPPELGCCSTLVELLLSENQLSTLPELQLEQLEILDLAKNQLKDLSGMRCGKLKRLEVSQNRLTRLPKTSGPLRELLAAKNQLQSIEFCDHQTLVSLDLSGNQLQELSLRSLPALDSLNVSNNALQKLELGALPQLTVLMAESNKLGIFPDGVVQLPRLNTLDLSNNDIRHVPPELGLLRDLKRVVLIGNPVRSVRPELLRGSAEALKKFLRTRLAEPEPSANGSDTFHVELRSAVGTGQLDLSDRQLTHLPQLPRTLKLLDISSNHLAPEAVAGLWEMDGLQCLRATKNRLGDLSVAKLVSLQGLQELDLSRNGLSHLGTADDWQGSCAPNLGFLDLSGNALESQMLSNLLGACPKLQELRLRHCNLSFLPALQHRRLNTLDLEENRLSSLPVEWTETLPNLKTLLLANNDLRSSLPWQYGHWESLQVVSLTGNPLKALRQALLSKGWPAVATHLRNQQEVPPPPPPPENGLSESRSNEETGHLEALLQKLRQGVKALEEELETPGISRQQQSLVTHSLRMKRAELQRALRESQRLSDVAAEVPMV